MAKKWKAHVAVRFHITLDQKWGRFWKDRPCFQCAL
jgi:hypothetical protein